MSKIERLTDSARGVLYWLTFLRFLIPFIVSGFCLWFLIFWLVGGISHYWLLVIWVAEYPFSVLLLYLFSIQLERGKREMFTKSIKNRALAAKKANKEQGFKA